MIIPALFQEGLGGLPNILHQNQASLNGLEVHFTFHTTAGADFNELRRKIGESLS